MLSGTVLITGGAGYLGRGIMRRARDESWPVKFIVYSRDEQKHAYAKRKYPDARYVMGDIVDTQRLMMLAASCDYIIHTAAIKYIPECEAQPSEAIRVNIDGSRSVMDAARLLGVKRTVLISTDKAAAPLNTYGMTKAIVERMVFESREFPAPSGAEFVACRYGNMIGSTGSIWPVFKQQFAEQGFLQVTDPTMTRFFITIDNAIDIIVSALTGAPAGCVVIPTPKAAVLGEIVNHLTALWGADQPQIIGLRPGEKSHEDMVSFNEVERLVPTTSGNWLLTGPTGRQGVLSSERFDSIGMRSSDAKRLTPTEFVDAAVESERV